MTFDEGYVKAAKRKGVILTRDQFRSTVIGIPGVELTALKGLGGLRHILALGIEPGSDYHERDVLRLRSIEDTLKFIRDELGGIAIAVHSTPKGGRTCLSYDEIAQFPPDPNRPERPHFHGIETHHRKHAKPHDLMRLADEHGLAHLGASDFHCLNRIGSIVTEIDGAAVTDWRGFIEAVLERQTRSVVVNKPPEGMSFRALRERLGM